MFSDASTKVSMVMIVTKKYRVKGEENSEADDAEAQENGGLNNTDLEGFTPLDVAIMNNNVRAAAELIEGGANIDVRPDRVTSIKYQLIAIFCRKTPSKTLTPTTGPFTCPAPTDTWP